MRNYSSKWKYPYTDVRTRTPLLETTKREVRFLDTPADLPVFEVPVFRITLCRAPILENPGMQPETLNRNKP